VWRTCCGSGTPEPSQRGRPLTDVNPGHHRPVLNPCALRDFKDPLFATVPPIAAAGQFRVRRVQRPGKAGLTFPRNDFLMFYYLLTGGHVFHVALGDHGRRAGHRFHQGALHHSILDGSPHRSDGASRSTDAWLVVLWGAILAMYLW
jgi:hypothetical protein